MSSAILSAGIFPAGKSTPRRGFVAQGPFEFLVRGSLTAGDGPIFAVAATGRSSGMFTDYAAARARLASLPVSPEFLSVAASISLPFIAGNSAGVNTEQKA